MTGAGLSLVILLPVGKAGMEKFASPGKGNGLRASKQVKPGQLLYRAEPFAYVVTKKRLGGVCERCLGRYWLSGPFFALLSCAGFALCDARAMLPIPACKMRRVVSGQAPTPLTVQR